MDDKLQALREIFPEPSCCRAASAAGVHTFAALHFPRGTAAAMATYFPAELVTEVQVLMDANVGPITRWSNVLEVFLKHIIAYKVAELAPR